MTSTPTAPHTTPRHHTLPAALDEIGFTRAHIWVVALIMAGMFFDTLEQDTTGAIGPALTTTFHISTDQLVLINTLTTVGGLVGRLIGGYLADRRGRRVSLSVNLLLYTLGGVLSAVAPAYPMLLASRFIVGVGLGGEFTVGLALISEMVATRRRGSVVGSCGFASGGIGNFVAYGLFALVLGPLNGALGGDRYSWRWLFVLLAVPAVLVVVFRRYLPESPRFLLATGRSQEANRVLTRLASGRLRPVPTDADVVTYVSGTALPPTPERSSAWEFVRGRLLRRTLAIGAASWMAFGAQVTLLTLLPTLLVSKGYSISSSLLYTMIMYGGSTLGALVAAILASRLPRRVTVCAAAVLGCAAAVCFAELGDGTARILLFGSIFQFFSLLLNNTLGLWSPELYPTRVRALGTSFVNGIGNIAGAVMPFAAVFVFHRAGVTGVFLAIAAMYALLCLAAAFGPETLGRSLEDISEHTLDPHPVQRSVQLSVH